MKVLIIQPWIRQGGAEQISVYLASELQRSGHSCAITCVFVDLNGMTDTALEVNYVTPARWVSDLLKRSRLLFLLLGPLVLLWLSWRASDGIDVLNPHNFPASWVAVIVGALRHIPVVWTCNEPPDALSLRHAANVGLGDFFGWFVASSWLDRLFVRRIASIYVPSEKTRIQVEDRYGVLAEVVPLGVDVAFFEADPAKGRVSGLLGEDKYVIATVGKLHPQKNQIACIEAIAEVVKEIPQVVLAIAGDGPMAGAWRARVHRLGMDNNVKFLGWLNAFEVRELYALCQLNLFPPMNQSWGLTPFEALCGGRASIVSSDSGAAEVISRHQIGLVCEPTVSGIAGAIRYSVASAEEVNRMASRGKAYVKRHLTWGNYAERVLALFRSAGDGRASASQLPSISSR